MRRPSDTLWNEDTRLLGLAIGSIDLRALTGAGPIDARTNRYALKLWSIGTSDRD